MSQKRLNRYLLACNGDKRKAMTLYRYNRQNVTEEFDQDAIRELVTIFRTPRFFLLFCLS